jgi:hypothetical protein
MWPHKIYAANVTQRSVRASARELRTALRAAPEPVKAEIQRLLLQLQALDEQCDDLLAKVGDNDEVDPETDPKSVREER